MNHIKILVPANLSFSSWVREFSKEVSSLVGFWQRQTNLFKLIIDELFMNAVRYWSNNESNVFIEFVIDGERIICAIEDDGQWEEKVSAEDLNNIIIKEQENISLHKAHWRGLAQITSKLVSAFEISNKESGGLRIEFVVEINKELEKKKIKKHNIKNINKHLHEEIIYFNGIMDSESTYIE